MKIRLTSELAYLCGVLYGDGSIIIREHKGDYEIKCIGNPKDEKKFYKTIVCPLFLKIFDKYIKPKHHDKKTTYGIRLWSKEIVLFLKNEIGFPIGKKYEQMKIPKIFEQNKKLLFRFIRGVADTDFCISFKKKGKKFPYYPVISGSSKSEYFLNQIALILENEGFKVNKFYTLKVIDSRFKKGFSIINRIELNGQKQFKYWLIKIGFNNPKHLNKIKKYGR